MNGSGDVSKVLPKKVDGEQRDDETRHAGGDVKPSKNVVAQVMDDFENLAFVRSIGTDGRVQFVSKMKNFKQNTT